MHKRVVCMQQLPKLLELLCVLVPTWYNTHRGWLWGDIYNTTDNNIYNDWGDMWQQHHNNNNNTVRETTYQVLLMNRYDRIYEGILYCNRSLHLIDCLCQRAIIYMCSARQNGDATTFINIYQYLVTNNRIPGISCRYVYRDKILYGSGVNRSSKTHTRYMVHIHLM